MPTPRRKIFAAFRPQKCRGPYTNGTERSTRRRRASRSTSHSYGSVPGLTRAEHRPIILWYQTNSRRGLDMDAVAPILLDRTGQTAGCAPAHLKPASDWPPIIVSREMIEAEVTRLAD